MKLDVIRVICSTGRLVAATALAMSIVLSATAAPPPGKGPKPVLPPLLSFAGSSDLIAPGQPVLLSWAAANTRKCSASGDWSGRMEPDGTYWTSPLTTSSAFTLTCSGKGGEVSETVTVQVQTDTVVPSVQISADQMAVLPGEMIRLAWSGDGIDACVAADGWSGAKPLTGNEEVGPIRDNTKFSLVCTGPGGTADDGVAVTVVAAALPTVTVSAASTQVDYGASTDITWSAHDADSCLATDAWSGSKPMQGEQPVGPLSSDATFVLTCTGTGGTASASASVSVAPAPGPTMDLTASPTTIENGETTLLSWMTTHADDCSASGAWSGTMASSGSEQTAALFDTATFTLSCEGVGGSVTQSVTVTVSDPVPAPDSSISLSVASGWVDPGATTTLEWSGVEVTSCTAGGGWTGDKPISGTEIVGPIYDDTTFNLSCVGESGNTMSMASVQVRYAILSWDPPTQNMDSTTLTDLSGFVVHFGPAPRSYSQSVEINEPNQTNLELTLTPGTWYFAVTAKTSGGAESAYSNEVSKTIEY